MKSWANGSLLACLGLAACLLAGCGGGGGSASQNQLATDSTHGALSFRIVFPTIKRSVSSGVSTRVHTRVYDGSIPVGSHSVSIRLTNPTTGALLAPVRVVNDTQRPDGVTGSISVGFGLLPAGPIKVDIATFPDLAAAGNVLATGTANGQIVALQTTTLDIGLTLTLATLTLTPPTQTIHTFQAPPMNGQVMGTAKDANGKPLIYPLEYTVNITDILTVDTVSPDFMVATLRPLVSFQTPTPVMVTVTEPNSGMTATVQVIVGP